MLVMNTAYSITSKNQVTIPVEVRKSLGLSKDSQIQYVREGNRVYLKRAISVKEVQKLNKKLISDRNNSPASNEEILTARQKFYKDKLVW